MLLELSEPLAPGQYELRPVGAAPAPGDVPAWLAVALAEVGVHETRGGETPRIMEFHRAARDGLDEDEDAWCGAFIAWLMAQTGHPVPDRAATARTWLTYGQEEPPAAPRLGALCVLWRVSPDGWQGHIGLFLARRGGRVWLLGGNQSDSLSVTSFPEAQILGFRWP